MAVSGLARAVTWTQNIGYSYPSEIFRPVVTATFPLLSEPEIRHCVHEHQRCQAEWQHRVSAEQWIEAWDEQRGRV